MVRAAGIEPAQAFRPYGFSYPLRLSPPRNRVWGLDYPFAVAAGLSTRRALGAARLVSTPSRRNRRAWLGIATFGGFPEFERFCTAGFPDGHSIFQVRCVYQFRHARTRRGL